MGCFKSLGCWCLLPCVGNRGFSLELLHFPSNISWCPSLWKFIWLEINYSNQISPSSSFSLHLLVNIYPSPFIFYSSSRIENPDVLIHQHPIRTYMLSLCYGNLLTFQWLQIHYYHYFYYLCFNIPPNCTSLVPYRVLHVFGVWMCPEVVEPKNVKFVFQHSCLCHH